MNSSLGRRRTSDWHSLLARETRQARKCVPMSAVWMAARRTQLASVTSSDGFVKPGPEPQQGLALWGLGAFGRGGQRVLVIVLLHPRQALVLPT